MNGPMNGPSYGMNSGMQGGGPGGPHSYSGSQWPGAQQYSHQHQQQWHGGQQSQGQQLHGASGLCFLNYIPLLRNQVSLTMFIIIFYILLTDVILV